MDIGLWTLVRTVPLEVNKITVSPSYVKTIYRTLTNKLIIEFKELVINVEQGGFFIFTLFNCASRPSDSTVSEDAGIEPRAVATLALAVRHSNHSPRSHPQLN